MEFLINFLIFEIICIAILFIVVLVILPNYTASYLRDINRSIEKGFEHIEKEIYNSVERIIKYLDKRDCTMSIPMLLYKRNEENKNKQER